jgi:hypothetical protein
MAVLFPWSHIEEVARAGIPPAGDFPAGDASFITSGTSLPVGRADIVFACMLGCVGRVPLIEECVPTVMGGADCCRLSRVNGNRKMVGRGAGRSVYRTALGWGGRGGRDSRAQLYAWTARLPRAMANSCHVKTATGDRSE